MMVFGRKTVFAAGMGLALALAPVAALAGDAGQTGVLDNGAPFSFHYVVDFWRNAEPGATLSDDLNENAPGYINRQLTTFVHDKTMPKSEVDLIVRKLTLVYNALLEQPSLRDIRGNSLNGYINIRRLPNGAREADLSIAVTSIDLKNPQTLNKGGYFVTPAGERPSLVIGFNKPFEGLTNDKVVVAGTYNGIGIRYSRNEFGGYLSFSDRPLTVTKIDFPGAEPYEIKNPDFIDKTARPSKLQLLTMDMGMASTVRSFKSQKHSPTSGTARLIAAAFMADWPQIARQMEAMK